MTIIMTTKELNLSGSQLRTVCRLYSQPGVGGGDGSFIEVGPWWHIIVRREQEIKQD